MEDVFVSYASVDRPWAEWLTWALEENGYTITAQALDGQPGESLVNNVQQAISQSGFTVLVLSENYITIAGSEPNWPPTFRQDPVLPGQKVIPIRVETCQLPQSWGLPGFVNIVDQGVLRQIEPPHRSSLPIPTEAEWKCACRAGMTTPFHFGETIITDLTNYDGTDASDGSWSGSYGRGPKGVHRRETTPINYFKNTNAFGLCDMYGNVWEWCQDHWHDNYGGAPTDCGSAWLDEDSEGENVARVVRGGSWDGNPRNCRSASRRIYYPRVADYVIGFRVVCSAPRTL